MSPRRYELSDFEWSVIEPLLPNKPRGVPRSDDRTELNGIYTKGTAGCLIGGFPNRGGADSSWRGGFAPCRQR